MYKRQLEAYALLFLPAKAPFDLYSPEMKRGLQLYVKRVFVMDECKELLPTHLRFVRGVVDAHDLSLNVSREILQKDRQIQLIKKQLVKKVLAALDERVHDFFWEMNAQVADTAEAHRWQPRPAELTLMDCYCVHRGVEAEARTFRTWLRLSFEERRRVFDRLGNAHNPLFDYAWPMVERDIEALGLVAFRPDGDPSLRVFPWQAEDGTALPAGAAKTRPRLRPDR